MTAIEAAALIISGFAVCFFDTLAGQDLISRMQPKLSR